MDAATIALVALVGAFVALVVAALVAAARDREYRRGYMDADRENDTYDARAVRRAKLADIETDALDDAVDEQ
jgi:hypothetical protein